jgi:class 3 adenylate cyclase
VLNEPVRGVTPEPSFGSLSGLEQLRWYIRGAIPPTSHSRLIGYRLTQVSSGTVVINCPLSPWLDINDGFVDLTAIAELTVFATAMTGAPSASHGRTVNQSLRYLRACTVEDDAVIARGRILHAGTNFTTVDVLLEDALGRAVAHATGSVVIIPVDPPPPLIEGERPATVDEPVYATPDPPRRPLPPEITRSALLGTSPLFSLFGAKVIERSEGFARVSLPASEWFCNMYREVQGGIIGTMIGFAGAPSLLSLAETGQRLVVINQTVSLMKPVPPDGRALTATSTVVGERDGILICNVETLNADGEVVMVGQGTGMLLDRRSRTGPRTVDRKLLSVLFTDLVGSTEHARGVGDAQWREVLDEHDGLVRKQLALHKGREVKTMGDGFLATFDSPTRAVQCARAIRDGLHRIGLGMRAGIHTGECDIVGGDVTGVAVHVAARVQSAAGTGEVLVSNTVRDLVSDSDLVFEDRGEHTLKGMDSPWRLFALCG